MIMKNLKIILLALFAFLGIGLSVALGNSLLFPKESVKKFGTINMYSDRNYIDAIGTATTSPATLSQSYASNTSAVLRIPGLSNIVVQGRYMPAQGGSILYIQIERSVDNGQTYYPFDNVTPSTDRTSVYSNQFVTSSTAVPYQIPGSGNSASGTAITFSFDATIAADFVRISAKESTTGTQGTLYAQLLSTNH